MPPMQLLRLPLPVNPNRYSVHPAFSRKDIKEQRSQKEAIFRRWRDDFPPQNHSAVIYVAWFLSYLFQWELMQSGMGFNVWRDGEIHPTAVLAISGSLSNLQIGRWLFGCYQGVAGGQGCLLSPVPPISSALTTLLRLALQYILTWHFSHPYASLKH